MQYVADFEAIRQPLLSNTRPSSTTRCVMFDSNSEGVCNRHSLVCTSGDAFVGRISIPLLLLLRRGRKQVT